MARKPLQMRLSEETLQLLDEIAAQDDLNRTSTVTTLIRKEADRRGSVLAKNHRPESLTRNGAVEHLVEQACDKRK